MPQSGAYIFGCAGLELTLAERTFFAAAQPWGFILFQRNIETPDQTRALCSSLRDAVGWNAPILIDQEGGRVQRMWAPHWREYPPALDQSAAGPRAMYLRSRLIAHELKSIGIDVNCAPLGDIARETTHPVLKNRCYGGDVQTVVSLAEQVIAGQSDGGVLSVLKHIPGHGLSAKDSHKALPVVREDAKTLHALDFAPFRALAGQVGLGMTAHLIFEAFDPDRPATTSPIMHDVIRKDIGFQGLLMTDDLSMEALSGAPADRARAAIMAGCDLILHCNGDLDEMRSVADTSGPMTPTAQQAGKRALMDRKTPAAVDIPALEAEFNALLTA